MKPYKAEACLENHPILVWYQIPSHLVFIQIPTTSQVKPKLKQRENSNEKPLNHFNCTPLPDHYLKSPTPTTEILSMYIYITIKRAYIPHFLPFSICILLTTLGIFRIILNKFLPNTKIQIVILVCELCFKRVCYLIDSVTICP